MIVSSPRIFLIFLVPLLTHGAPTPPHDDNSRSGSQPGYQLPRLRDVLAGTPGLPPHTNLGLPTNAMTAPPHDDNSHSGSQPGHQLPRLGDVLAGVPGSPPHTNLGLTTNAMNSWPVRWEPLPKYTPQATPPTFHTNPSNKNTCWLSEGTMYQTPTTIRTIEKSFNTRTAGVAITPKGDMIDLPSGTRVIVSMDYSLPAPPTEIRLISDKEPEVQTIIMVPHDARFRQRIFPQLDWELTTVRSTSTDRLVFTQGHIIFTPQGTTIIRSNNNIIRLPRGNTKIQSLRKKDLDNVMDWCRENQREGMPTDQLEEHMEFCFYFNLWRINWWDIESPSTFVRV